MTAEVNDLIQHSRGYVLKQTLASADGSMYLGEIQQLDNRYLQL
jgi:hypothetical protein